MTGIKKEVKTMGREAILKSIKNNKPDLLSIPEIDVTQFTEEVKLIEVFKNNVNLVGGNIKEVDPQDIDVEIKKMYPNAEKIVSVADECSLGTVQISGKTDPHELNSIDLAIIKGSLGVAENGAVWISENEIVVRALPFITNDLVIVLPKDQLYLHLLHAYEIIGKRERRFGLFLSGPSKTADIEQCLVIGAQGAISLTVILI
ncbi:LutC/YkgG family protein [Maribacter luteus]|uniref:LutC/YkgG family protein n=1 Tax=Maribacter luteus TaxID=2594478 RepID=UPI002492B5F8|nr:LUD domain-containing protein [Maribacter luteus]